MSMESFDYPKSNAIEIDERTCAGHLVSLNRAGEVEKDLDFVYRLLHSALRSLCIL